MLNLSDKEKKKFKTAIQQEALAAVHLLEEIRTAFPPNGRRSDNLLAVAQFITRAFELGPNV